MASSFTWGRSKQFGPFAALLVALVLFMGLVPIVDEEGLGGAVVLNDLPAEIVAVHLGTALTILTLLALVTTAAFARNETLAVPRVRRDFRRVALLALGATFGLMLVGSYVSGAGYGLACSGWPLCNREVIPTVDAASVQVHFLHRFLALVLGLILVALVWLGWHGCPGV